MNIFKTLAETYKSTQDAGKIRSANSEINKQYGLGISARALKEYFDTNEYEKVFEDGNMEKFFSDMLTQDEAENLNEVLKGLISGIEKEEEKEEEVEVDLDEVFKELDDMDKPKVTETAVKGGFSIDLPLGAMIMDAVKDMAPKFNKENQALIKKAIEDVAKQMRPNIININSVKVGEVKGKTHKDFKHALDILTSQGKLFLKGEAGTGKTYLAEQLADAMSLEFDSLSLTAGISEGYLIGRTNIQGDFISTRFIELYENGGVFLLDEVDAADSNTLLILNKAISSNSMPVPMRTDNPVAKRHENFFIICASNTWGNGAEMDYAGREVLDEAFLNRFSVAKLELDWDVSLERELLKTDLELCDRLHELREKCKKHSLNRIITTRTILDAFKYKQTGKSNDQVLNQVMVGWTKEEVAKVK